MPSKPRRLATLLTTALLAASMASLVAAEDVKDEDLEDEPEVFRSGFVFSPEALYFSFPDSDADFAVDLTTGTVHDVEADYELGWRAGLGYRWENGYDVTFRGTVVETDEAEQVAGNFAKGSSATGFVDVDYHLIDVEFGKVFGKPERHWARVFGSLRAAEIDQLLVVDFGAGGRTLDSVEFDGYGLRVGAEGHVGLGAGWGLFLRAGGSVLAGDFTATHDVLGGSVDAQDDFDRTVSVLEAAAGLSWQLQRESSIGFGVRLGWEISEWGDVLTPESLTTGDDEDFSAQGAFLRLEFVF